MKALAKLTNPVGSKAPITPTTVWATAIASLLEFKSVSVFFSSSSFYLNFWTLSNNDNKSK